MYDSPIQVLNVDSKLCTQFFLLNLVKQYKKKYPTAVVLGHRDLSPDLNKDGKITSNEWVKICPCFSVTEEYKNI